LPLKRGGTSFPLCGKTAWLYLGLTERYRAHSGGKKKFKKKMSGKKIERTPENKWQKHYWQKNEWQKNERTLEK